MPQRCSCYIFVYSTYHFNNLCLRTIYYWYFARSYVAHFLLTPLIVLVRLATLTSCNTTPGKRGKIHVQRGQEMQLRLETPPAIFIH